MSNTTKIVLLVLGTLVLAWILARANGRRWHRKNGKMTWQRTANPLTPWTGNTPFHSEAGLGPTTSAGTTGSSTTTPPTGTGSNVAVVNPDRTKAASN